MGSEHSRTTAPPARADSDDSARIYRKIGWRVIPFLMLCYVFAYLDRSNIGLAKLVITEDLHFNEAIYGLGAGLFYLGYSVFEIPSNLLLKRTGARLAFMRIMICWGLVSAAFAFITMPSHFYVLRLLLGAAEAGFFPGVIFFLTFWAPASRRAQFTAIFMSSMALSGLIGGPVSGWIMTSASGLGGLKGWQWMFLLEGLPSCFIGLLAYYALADDPSQVKWLTEAERETVRRDLELETREAGSVAAHTSFAAALRDPKVYALAAMSVALISGIGGIALWLPSILHRAGVTNMLYVGLLSGLPYAVAIVAQQYAARRSDRHGERRWHAAIPAAIGGAGWLSLPLVSGRPGLALLCLTVAAAGTFGATGPFWSMPAAYLRGTAAAGGIALITTFGGVSAFLSPLIVGWVAAKSGSLVFGQYYYGALMLLGAVLLVSGTASRAVSSSRVPIR
jgi:sugar phosphate permease